MGNKKKKITTVSAIMRYVIVYNVVGPMGYGWVYLMADGEQIPDLFTYDDDKPLVNGFYTIIPDTSKEDRLVVLNGKVH